jgi:hypothetical protein
MRKKVPCKVSNALACESGTWADAIYATLHEPWNKVSWQVDQTQDDRLSEDQDPWQNLSTSKPRHHHHPKKVLVEAARVGGEFDTKRAWDLEGLCSSPFSVDHQTTLSRSSLTRDHQRHHDLIPTNRFGDHPHRNETMSDEFVQTDKQRKK